MFDQKKSDSNIENRQHYRVPQPQCSGLDLSSSQFTPASFRKLVGCFNSNGSIGDLEALVRESSDAQIQSVGGLLNEGVLGNQKRLFQSRETLDSLKARGQIDSLFSGVGAILKDDQRLKAIFSLIDSARGTRLEPNAAEEKALVAWLKKLTPEDFLHTLEILKKITASPAYRELRTKFESRPITEAEAKKIAKLWKSLVSAPQPRGKTETLLKAFASGKATYFLNFSLGRSSSEAFEKAPETARLLNDTFGRGAQSWKSLADLHRAFETPISCMQGGKVFKDPWKDLHGELAQHVGRDYFDFITRFGTTTTVGLAGRYCTIPDGFYENYPRFLKLITGPSGAWMTQVLEFCTKGGLSLDLGRWLSESGEHFGEIVSVLQEREIAADVVLVASLLEPADRDFVAKGFETLFQPDPALGNVSSWNRLTSWASRLTENDWREFGRLLSQALGTDSESLASALESMREFTLSNASHPWFEAVKEILIQSLEGTNSIFGLTELSELPSFPRAVKLLHAMSQDGRLASLILGFFDLIDRYAEAGRVPMDLNRVSREESPALHSWSSKDLRAPSVQSPISQSLSACLKLNLRASIDTQITTYFDCLGSTSSLRSVEEALSILSQEKTSRGESFASMLGSRVLDLPFRTAKESEAFLKDLSSAIRDGRVEDSARALESMLFGAGNAYSPLNQVVTGVKTKLGSSWRSLLEGVGRAIQDPDLPHVLKLSKLASRSSTVAPQADPKNTFDAPRIERWIRNKECITDASAVRSRRSIVEKDFEEALSGWELVDGQYRSEWDRDELWRRLTPVFRRVSKPRVSAGVADLVSGFSSRPQEVIEWFKKRSSDYRILHVIPIGERYPRVRLMSTIDRLEVLLKAADFSYFFPENFALKFMAMLGEAWGDEPRDQWPAEIRARYASGGRPMTLAEALAEMKRTLVRYENLGGLPRVHRCAQVADPNDPPEVQRYETSDPDPLISLPISYEVKANLFNLHQTISVLEENLPGSGTEMDSGLKFLRELFYGVYVSTPPGERTDTDPARNELGLILELNQVSFLRALSVYYEDLEDPTLLSAHTDSVGFLADALSAPGSENLLKILFSGDGLKFVKAIFDSSDSLPQSASTRGAFYLLAEGRKLDAGAGVGRILSRDLPSLLPHLVSRAEDLLVSATAPELERVARGAYVQTSTNLQTTSARWVKRRLEDERLVSAGVQAMKAVLEDEVLFNSSKELVRRWENFRNSSDFRRYDVEKIGDALLDYFSQTDQSSSSVAASRMRGWVGDRFLPQAGGQGPSDVEELLKWATDKPDQFSKVIRGGVEGARSQELAEFLEILERHLPR